MDRTIYQGQIVDHTLELEGFPTNIEWRYGKPPRDDKNGRFLVVNQNHGSEGGFVVVPCTCCIGGKFGYTVDGMIHTVPNYLFWVDLRKLVDYEGRTN